MKVVVAMSGGVDSSVAACLLKDSGYEVVGITLRLFQEDSPARIQCCGSQISGHKARQVCDVLGVRHYFKDSRNVFSEKVIKNFVSEYKSGRTPNPCVECNRAVKFSYLFSIAREMGADFLATGHYARILREPVGGQCPRHLMSQRLVVPGGGAALLRGIDKNKDQSYFLYCLKETQLSRILFPLGDLTKKEVRETARLRNLATAGEKESKDICFVGGADYGAYLRRNGLKTFPGVIADSRGRIVGRHRGFFNYTIGQRKGLGIFSGQRLYVTGINPEKNQVTVGPLEEAMTGCFRIAQVNWISDNTADGSTLPFGSELRAELLAINPERSRRIDSFAAQGRKLEVQLRYRHKPVKCSFTHIAKGTLEIKLESPQFAVTPGQSAVFYDADRVVGGGIIERDER
ncbi:MAG: tRNA 2-thiouridine(34) synthase MnmA [Elusimicrobia bacterium]|nr:tRNA 2-thiouridine(34) synthase MnmA [Elusimicrobiota bacterium]